MPASSSSYRCLMLHSICAEHLVRLCCADRQMSCAAQLQQQKSIAQICYWDQIVFSINTSAMMALDISTVYAGYMSAASSILKLLHSLRCSLHMHRSSHTHTFTQLTINGRHETMSACQQCLLATLNSEGIRLKISSSSSMHPSQADQSGCHAIIRLQINCGHHNTEKQLDAMDSISAAVSMIAVTCFCSRA